MVLNADDYGREPIAAPRARAVRPPRHVDARGAGPGHGARAFSEGRLRADRTGSLSRPRSMRRIACCIFAGAVGVGAWAGDALATDREAIGATQQRTLQVAAVQRSYRLHVPRGLDRAPVRLWQCSTVAAARPGRSSVRADSAGFSRPRGFLVAIRRLPQELNDGRGRGVAAQRDGNDDVGFVAALIDELSAQLRIDPKRIYSTGISNGAMFSHQLAIACRRAHAAIAPAAGGLPQPLLARFDAGPVSALIVRHARPAGAVPRQGGQGAGRRARQRRRR